MGNWPQMGPNLGGALLHPDFFEFWARGNCPSTDASQPVTTYDQIPRFRLFWQSKDDRFCHCPSCPPFRLESEHATIHISTTHGSATISLINQFGRFHSTFTGFNAKFNCHSLLVHDAGDKAKNLHLQNKFVLTDHWTKTIETWSRVTWSRVLRSYGVSR